MLEEPLFGLLLIRKWVQDRQRQSPRSSGSIHQGDRQISGQLPDDLTTDAAGHDKIRRTIRHGQGLKPVLPRGDGMIKRAALGADGERITAVFNISRGIDLPGSRQYGRTDPMIRIRGVSVSSGTKSGGDELILHELPLSSLAGLYPREPRITLILTQKAF